MPDVRHNFFSLSQVADEKQNLIKVNVHLVHIKTNQCMTADKSLDDT